MLYIEQPSTTGFSTGSIAGLTGENVIAEDFFQFLQSFYEVFEELKVKELRLTGESYAGFYIPYIATRILDATAAEKKSIAKLHGLMINDGVSLPSCI